MRKFRQGKQITSLNDFENYTGDWFSVQFGRTLKATHRGFLISWQYRQLKKFIDNGWVFETERIEDGV